MVIETCIPLDSPSEWKESLRGIKHAFAHTWENCYAMYLTTGFNTFLYCYETEKVRIVCPIAERPFDGSIDIVTPYGFSGFVGNGDCPEFPHHWREFVRQKNYTCGYIQLNPLFENGTYYEAGEAHRYSNVYCVDLGVSVDEILARFEKRRRKQVRDAERTSTSIVLEKQLLKDFLLNNYDEFFQRKNAAGAYNFTRETMSFLCDLDDVLLVGRGQPEKLEAVSLLAYTLHVGEAFFQVSLPGGQHHAVALVWYRVKYLKSLQVPFLNLGGGVRENDSVAQFKERFGALKLPLKCLKQVYNPEIYENLCRRMNTDPHDLSGYFPSYRQPLR